MIEIAQKWVDKWGYLVAILAIIGYFCYRNYVWFNSPRDFVIDQLDNGEYRLRMSGYLGLYYTADFCIGRDGDLYFYLRDNDEILFESSEKALERVNAYRQWYNRRHAKKVKTFAIMYVEE